MLVWSLPSRSRIRKLPAIHMSCIRSWVSYPSLLQPRTNLSKKYAEKLYQNMVCLSLTCQKNSILHQNISGDYISTPYCRKVCMLIVFFSALPLALHLWTFWHPVMNFIAYFSVPCMVSEEEQDWTEQNHRSRWKGPHEWHHVRADLGSRGLENHLIPGLPQSSRASSETR
jgi:hypothetical protein